MPLTFPIAEAGSSGCHAGWSALTSLSVSDQGPGNPADFRKQIFEKFTQVDGSNTRRTSGTGLGLTISKAIVKKHDGQIKFESELGKSTTFSSTYRIFLPQKRALYFADVRRYSVKSGSCVMDQ